MSGPLRSVHLDNGLILQCVDQSKKIAADRWYICIYIEIEIPVEKKWFVNYYLDDIKFEKICRSLGNQVCFKQKNERNFISNDQKEQVVTDICDRASEIGATYFSHPDFAAKYILKCFSEKQNRHY